jgi:hypothetical protein
MGSKNLHDYYAHAYQNIDGRLIKNHQNTIYINGPLTFIMDTQTGIVRRYYSKSMNRATIVYSFHYDNQKRLCKYSHTTYEGGYNHSQISWQFNAVGQIISYKDSNGNMWDHTWGVDNIYLPHIQTARNIHERVQYKCGDMLIGHYQTLERFAKMM